MTYQVLIRSRGLYRRLPIKLKNPIKRPNKNLTFSKQKTLDKNQSNAVMSKIDHSINLNQIQTDHIMKREKISTDHIIEMSQIDHFGICSLIAIFGCGIMCQNIILHK